MIAIYRCEVCFDDYRTADEADACEQMHKRCAEASFKNARELERAQARAVVEQLPAEHPAKAFLK